MLHWSEERLGQTTANHGSCMDPVWRYRQLSQLVSASGSLGLQSTAALKWDTDLCGHLCIHLLRSWPFSQHSGQVWAAGLSGFGVWIMMLQLMSPDYEQLAWHRVSFQETAKERSLNLVRLRFKKKSPSWSLRTRNTIYYPMCTERLTSIL